MKRYAWLTIAAVVAAFALQGCATSGDVQSVQGAQPANASQASATTTPVVTSINTKSDFAAVQAAVRQQMQPGGRYASVDPAGRATVNGRFQDMATLFAQYGSFDAMQPTARARINDDQNAINEVLAAHDGNRLICHDETPVGSHMPKRVCRRLSDIQNQQNNSQQMMRQMQMKPSQIGGH